MIWFYSYTIKQWVKVMVEEIRANCYWVEYGGQTIPIDKRRALTPYQYEILKSNGALRN